MQVNFGGLDKTFNDQLKELELDTALEDTLAGYEEAVGDAQDVLFGDEEEEEEEEMYFADSDHLHSSPLIRALRGDPAPKAHHHGLHEHQLVGAWRTAESPTWTNWRQELAAVHKIHRDTGLVTIQFILDQKRLTVPQKFVEPVVTEPPPVQVRYLPKGAPHPTVEEAMRPWDPHESYQQQQQPSQVPGLPDRMPHGGPGDPYPAAYIPPPPPEPEPARWPVPQNTAQALRNRSIPPDMITGEYGKHFYTELYKHNFWKNAPTKGGQRNFYIPLDGMCYEETKNGNLVPVERLPDGRIVRMSNQPEQGGGHQFQFGH